MAVIVDVLTAVLGYAQACNPYANIVIGALPADNGISMALGPSAPITMAMDKGMAYQLNIVLNAKHSNQQLALKALCDIHDALVKQQVYAKTSTYQITSIETNAAPAYTSREDNAQWLYSSSLIVKFYYR